MRDYILAAVFVLAITTLLGSGSSPKSELKVGVNDVISDKIPLRAGREEGMIGELQITDAPRDYNATSRIIDTPT